MAIIRRSGSGWQVLIRGKNYIGPKSRTFLCRDLAKSCADAVEERTKKVLKDIPVTLGEAINDYINVPLLLHCSAENEKYPLRVTAESQLERKEVIKIILLQGINISFIYSIIIVPPIPKDACGEQT